MIYEEHLEYANKVLSGEIVACENIKMACQRYLNWFNRTDMYFDKEAGDKVIRFIRKLKHFEGKYAGKNFELTLCQKWIVYAIFSWKWSDL